MFKEELFQLFLKILQINEKERSLSNSSYKTSIIVVPKTDKDIATTKTTDLIPDEHICKNTSTPNATAHQKDHTL
jgi:hypothetical protein